MRQNHASINGYIYILKYSEQIQKTRTNLINIRHAQCYIYTSHDNVSILYIYICEEGFNLVVKVSRRLGWW